jgi:hypothetical protein
MGGHYLPCRYDLNDNPLMENELKEVSVKGLFRTQSNKLPQAQNKCFLPIKTMVKE